MRARISAGILACLLSIALLAGCAESDGDSGDGSASGTTTASASSAPTSDAASTDGGTEGAETDQDGSTDAPPFPANTEPDSQAESADSRNSVTEIRVGRHDGFDRVVFEVAGQGTPGWDVRYVDEASSQGSGETIDVEGGAILQVTLTGMGYPEDTGAAEWTTAEPLPLEVAEVVTDFAWDSTFEGTSVAFVGTADEVPFRVYSLADPVRVVLEVADPS